MILQPTKIQLINMGNISIFPWYRWTNNLSPLSTHHLGQFSAIAALPIRMRLCAAEICTDIDTDIFNEN